MPGSGFGLAKDKVESVITSLRNGLSTDLDLRKALPQADREGINSAYAELIILTRDDIPDVETPCGYGFSTGSSGVDRN